MKGETALPLHRSKVGFLVVGAQKAGTTALDAHLRQHPDLCMADVKEVHFFDNDRLFDRAPDYENYHRHFQGGSPSQLIGETTPAYMFWQQAPRRIWEYNRQIRLIFLLRNPVERAYSHWNMQRRKGRETLDFLEAIAMERERCRALLPRQCRWCSYLARGFYSEQIRRFQSFFPDANLLFLRSERLRDSPEETMAVVWDFLGVPAIGVSGLRQADAHDGGYERSMRPEERRRLLFIYEHEILQLERMLGWDCSDWLG